MKLASVFVRFFIQQAGVKAKLLDFEFVHGRIGKTWQHFEKVKITFTADIKKHLLLI